MMPHPLICTPFTEFNKRELTAVVSAKHPQHTSRLGLRERLPLFDDIQHFILGAEQPHPHVARLVVDEQ
jgi:hypothetical protein